MRIPLTCRLPRTPPAKLRRVLCAAFTAGAVALPGTGARAQCVGEDMLQDQRFAPLATEVAAEPYSSGNHWKASRDGATVSVIGTFHLYDPRLEERRPALLTVLGQSDLLLVEAGPEEMEDLKKAVLTDPDLMFITDGPTLPEQLSEEDWKTLSIQMQDRGIPAFFAAKFQPWYVSMILGMPACAVPDFSVPPYGLDQMLIDDAIEIALEVRALEPYDTVFSMFADLKPEEQTEMVRATLRLAGDSTDVYTTMVEAYFREEHRLIWEFSRDISLEYATGQRALAEQQFKAIEEGMLTSRNRAWIKVIEAEAKPGRHITVAVGAGHLSGPEGVLALLAQQGFTLERQAF